MQVKYDRKLLIAIGRSRKASQWQNKEVLWSGFLDKLATTTRTRETVAEYAALPKGERDTIKDVGGFVGGYLKNGKRNNASVVNRCMLCLDADNADPGLMDDLDMTFINAYALYSTHSHTPEKMRLRLIVPLTRTVTPDEYAAVSRRVADDLGLTRFDPTTFEPARLMYWPSTSEDGAFFFHCEDAPFLDPDEVLKTYADWRDASLWPTTQPVEERIRHTAGKQEDPTEKRGIIGAFCRAHTITDVLTHILPDRYTPTEQDDRYTFIGGSTTGGLVVYDDKYAFSHHATDPAGGKLCNAFDLVRWHLFTPGGTAPDGSIVGDEKSSIRRMQEYAAQDEMTKRQLAEERSAQAMEEFGDLDAENNISISSGNASDENWQDALEIDKQGRVKDTLGNLALILRNDPKLKDIAYNIHRSGIDIRRDADGKTTLPWTQLKPGWNESDLGAIQIYLERIYNLYTPSKLKSILLAIAAERSYHPVRDYIESLPAWDGVPRVDTLFIDYLGSPDTLYIRAIARKMMVAAVARIYEPGIKFDSVVVLNGPQGMGKSSFFAKLGGKWFSDSLTISDMKDKAAPEKLQGYWILELGELAGLKKMDVETVKAFITRQDDKFRHSYGYSVEDHPRQCIIVGSTNNGDGFLRDVTGNRRFWPVTCTANSPHRPWEVESVVPQLWAEAWQLYKNGEKLFLTPEEEKQAEMEQTAALESDVREGIDKVRDAYHKALETPADENMFRQLRLNQWVKQSIRWMPMDKWDECGGVVDPYQLEGRACYAGLDLSSTSDLTTLVLVFPPRDENEPYMVLPFFWLPEDTLALRVRRDHVMYDQWERQGFIQTTEGNVVHYGFIEKFICELGERYNIREIAYDRWNATMMVQVLEDDGFTMIPFGQGFRDMSPPTKELMRIVLEHRLNHGGHPVLRWNFDNAYVRTDPAGNLKLDKEKSTEKIDGAVALVMALDRAMKNQNGSDSVYNDRGLLLL